MSVSPVLNKLGRVYVRGASGVRDTLVKTDLVCGLVHLGYEAANLDRAEAAASRHLVYDPQYALPEGAIVEIDGAKWQSQRRTSEPVDGPTGTGLHHRRVFVQRVDL